MRLKARLTLVVIVMMVIVSGTLSFITIRRSSDLNTETTYKYAEELAISQSTEIQRGIENYAAIAKMLAELFGEYEHTSEDLRRGSFNDSLLSVINRNQDIPASGQHGFPIP